MELFATPGTPIASAQGVHHHLGHGSARSAILQEVNLSISPGQLVVMTGPSGSGKTTLLTLLGALRAGQTGSIRIFDRELVGANDSVLTDSRRQIGFIFQLHNLIESLSALENVLMASRLTDVADAKARADGADLLARLGLGERIHHKPAALSGGQRQRVAVARALVNAPKLILADEPTAALDGKATREVVALLREHAVRNAAAVIIVTHDNRILDEADRIVSMIDGTITSDVKIKEHVALCEMLHAAGIFSKLDPAQLASLAKQMRERHYRDQEVLVRQGDRGDYFFLLARGEAEVEVTGPDGPRKVAVLQAGRYFGERALITGDVRNATVIGRGEGTAFTLTGEQFDAALASVPSLHEQLQRGYFGPL